MSSSRSVRFKVLIHTFQRVILSITLFYILIKPNNPVHSIAHLPVPLPLVGDSGLREMDDRVLRRLHLESDESIVRREMKDGPNGFSGR